MEGWCSRQFFVCFISCASFFTCRYVWQE